MAVPRKIFRIEEMAFARTTTPTARKPTPRRAMLAATAPSRAAPAVTGLTTRIAGELEAVVRDGEQATEAILTAGESIDRAVANLAAILKGSFEQGLGHDVRDAVAQIFEACNFQDVTRQRIAKTMSLLGRIERALAGVPDEATQSAPLLHGPPLPHDPGHVSQREIDAILAGDDPAA
jgi:hypothetical protein